MFYMSTYGLVNRIYSYCSYILYLGQIKTWLDVVVNMNIPGVMSPIVLGSKLTV